MLVMALLVIIGILAVVVIMLSCQVSKMTTDMFEMDQQYKADKRGLQEDLSDCQYEKRELERKLAEAEERAKNAEAQRDFLKNSKTVPAGPAGWNVVFEGKEKT